MPEDSTRRLYVGVDVGGTNIQASLVEEAGNVLAREKRPTPREGGPDEALDAIEGAVRELLDDAGIPAAGSGDAGDLTAIGVAVAGVVDPKKGRVVVTPNMNLSGARVVKELRDRFGVRIALGNDTNLGTLGEVWLGAARGASSAFGILLGTGIGGGFVVRKRLWRGYRDSAAEVGHIVMEMGGPECGCGNRGCFEALASRTAIERDIRAAVRAGEETALTDILDGDLSQIKSGALRDALAAEDEVVTRVLRRASEVLGHACLTVRHLVDPEVIVLGGGVIEACGEFVFPIVREIVEADRLPGSREGGEVRLSALGDDAVVLGAVALARIRAKRSPFSRRFAAVPDYPAVEGTSFGEVTVGGTTYDHDLLIRAGGEIKKRKKGPAKKRYGTSHKLGPKELSRTCRGGPEVLFVGTGQSAQVELTDEGRAYLERRGIEVEMHPTPEVGEAFNRCRRRKAALIHVTC